jgi:hypothetical protein
MKKYSLDGKDYPFQMDNLAWENWEDQVNETVFNFNVDRLKHQFACLYHGIKRGCKIEGVGFSIEYEDFRESLSSMAPGDIFASVVDLSGVFDNLVEEASQEEVTEKK